MEPKVNEVWLSHGGNICVVVTNVERNALGFLWFDREDGVLCFTELRRQLAYKMGLTPTEALERMLT